MKPCLDWPIMNLPRHGSLRCGISTAVLLLLIATLYTSPAGNPLADLTSGKVRVSGLDAVFYSSESPPRKCLVLRAKKIHTDYEKRGPFRLGILPISILEDVTIHIPCPGEARAALVQTERLLTPAAKGRVEMRRARIRIPLADGQTNVLQAASITVARTGVLNLKGGFHITGPSGALQGSTAQLHTTGPKAGDVILQTGSAGQQSALGNLFAKTESIQPSKTTQHENPPPRMRMAHLPDGQQPNSR